MDVLVCLSKVPDTTTKIEFTDNKTKLNDKDVQYIINPADEWYGLVRGLELKESFGGTVTSITVGPQEDEAVMRKALALGADDAVRVNAEPKDAFYVAKQIAEYAREKNFDLVMMGDETIDQNGGQVGGMIAELLDMPYVVDASDLQVEGNKASLEHKITGGSQVVSVDLPVVVATAKGMADQRIPNMRGIMAARKKQFTVVEPVEQEPHTEIREYELPPPKSECKFIDPENPEELVDLLHNEAKVI